MLVRTQTNEKILMDIVFEKKIEANTNQRQIDVFYFELPLDN